MRYALISGGIVATIVDQSSIPSIPGKWAECDETVQPGYVFAGDVFSPPNQTSAYQWLIDVGPFFDRFGAAKMSILTSTNATVKAIVSDLQVRKWVDLKRPDVATGIDALIALGVSGVNAALKTSVLTNPVTTEENIALKKLYF